MPLLDDKPSRAEPRPTPSTTPSIIAAVKAALGERVSDVRASQRLTDSAACLVAQGRGPTASSSACWRARTAASAPSRSSSSTCAIPLVKAVSDAKLGARDADVADLAELLLDQAQILDGEVPADPAAFASRVNRLVARGLAGP